MTSKYAREKARERFDSPTESGEQLAEVVFVGDNGSDGIISAGEFLLTVARLVDQAREEGVGATLNGYAADVLEEMADAFLERDCGKLRARGVQTGMVGDLRAKAKELRDAG